MPGWNGRCYHLKRLNDQWQKIINGRDNITGLEGTTLFLSGDKKGGLTKRAKKRGTSTSFSCDIPSEEKEKARTQFRRVALASIPPSKRSARSDPHAKMESVLKRQNTKRIAGFLAGGNFGKLPLTLRKTDLKSSCGNRA